ncbi:MAG: hypothetical protein A2622_02705 [Bdellovibrionales bacterium RIFCSPHIGHO2_01_FULL_40_29]|nr:MAG: hypothetical protein A2622_02705 [Bdellovibrionales bacterium RIFCSPHIGHO2_01_FULL_40_29]OFZ33989.1 MAG: hypothetical protein A3D17_03125 [Bdellovibrionales bacterium RIFCSPHIGHO2_02_FULL_40_15]
MQKTSLVTLLVSSVLCLVGGVLAPAQTFAAANKVVLSADTNTKVVPVVPSKFGIRALIIRSTSLYDFQDGTRSDGMDYALLPSYKTSVGSFSAKIIYSQNLNDQSPEASDINDIGLTYAMKPIKWEWSPPYILTLAPTFSAVVPASRVSQKRDQLQTAFSAGASFGIIPDGIAAEKDGAWDLAIGLTVGRNFHAYEESLDGSVILNQYSSNQTLNLGYSYKQWSVGVEYIHKSRWSYQGNVQDSFELSQEIGYEINKNVAVALGHANAGPGLKANGSEPSLNVINENDSAVYAQLGVSF